VLSRSLTPGGGKKLHQKCSRITQNTVETDTCPKAKLPDIKAGSETDFE